ncbi:MAG: PepSY domain-containing protein [Pyrinomonadaceae bacterium]
MKKGKGISLTIVVVSIVIVLLFGLATYFIPGGIGNAQNKSGDGTTVETPNSIERRDHDDDKEQAKKLSRKDKKLVKVSMEQARSIALAKVPGTIIEEDIEKENGRLLYAFDIRDASGKIFDVEIDAITGEVLKATDDDEDEDGDSDDGTLSKVKNSVYKTAKSVKKTTLRTIGKLF